MSGFGALHLRRLRDHPGRTALSLTGIAVGSLLIVSVIGLFGSLTGSVADLSRLLSHASVEVTGSTNGGVDQAVIALVRSTPGVASEVPAVETPVRVGGVSALLVGADPSSASPVTGLGGGCLGNLALPTSGAGPFLVMGNRLASALSAHAGGTVTVYSNAHAASATVLAVLDCAPARRLNNGMFVATTLGTAEALAGRGSRVDAIFVTSKSGTSSSVVIARLRSVVGDQAIVSSPDLQVRLAQKGLRPLQQGLLLAVSIVFVVAGFLVFNTMSMAALERRRELATLRAIGGRRRTLLIGFLGEAAVLGVVGSVVGSLGGILVAREALKHVPTLFLDILAVQPRFILPATAVPTAVLVGTFAAVAAAAFAARSAVRVPPVEAMRPEGVLETRTAERHQRPIVAAAGSGLFVGGTIVTIFGEGRTSGGVLLIGYGAITLGIVVATFGLSGALARATAGLASRLGATGRLAAAGIDRAPRRVWATTLAVTVGTATVVGLGGLMANQTRTFARDFASFADTSLWVQTTSPDTIAVQPDLPLAWAPAIAAVPGVASVNRDQAAYITLDNEQVLLLGMGTGTNDPLYRGSGGAARRVTAGDGIIATKSWAQRHHLKLGDEVGLPTPTGRHFKPIAALVDLPVPVQGELGIDFADFTMWFGRHGATDLEIALLPGTDPTVVKRAVEGLIAQSLVKASVYTGRQILDGGLRSLSQITAIFRAMVWAVVAATALAVLNTMAISVVERRRELGILRAVGTSRRTIRRVVVIEAASITATGLLLGTIVGILQQVAGVRATGTLTGFTVHYQFVYLPLLTAFAASAVMAVAGAVGPAWQAGKVDVISAIGYE